jgi:Kef-type K+ transport system membrane component KefB
MILLAVVASMATGGGIQWWHLSIVTIEAIGFALFMIFVGPRVIRRVRPGLQRLSMHDAPLILSLAICLGLSVASTTIGMAAIIGAFFAGLIFADYSPEWNLRPRIHAIYEFLSPFFFFTMGARLDLGVFSREVIITASIITVLAFISKIVGCGLPLMKEGRDIALKVALIGLQMNAISQRAYAIIIFMTALTTLVPPFFIKRLFRSDAESQQFTAVQVEEEAASEENVSGTLG